LRPTRRRRRKSNRRTPSEWVEDNSKGRRNAPAFFA
jgi:hypothetical protein